jgi:hypothetical protein
VVNAATRLERVVCGVCAAAVRDAGAGGIIVVDDRTPEGELTCNWLMRALGETRVWRAASLAGNVEGLSAAEAEEVAVRRAAEAHAALVAHPANRTALLLGGRFPRADLFPLGDVPAAQVQALVGRWSAPAAVESLARALGGAAALDDALERLLERGVDPAQAVATLPEDAATELVRLWHAGRWWRLRPRVVPKLGARTIGIDLFD